MGDRPKIVVKYEANGRDGSFYFTWNVKLYKEVELWRRCLRKERIEVVIKAIRGTSRRYTAITAGS